MLVLNVLTSSVLHMPWNSKSCRSISESLEVFLPEQEDRDQHYLGALLLTTVSYS